MVNLILKFVENKNNKGQLVAFSNKKVHFICKDNDLEVKSGEYWECFLWTERDKYNLVKPYKKIDPVNLKEEEQRVNQFNKEISMLENKIGDDFEKVVFDEKNKPFLLSKNTFSKTKDKFPTYVVKKVKDRVFARPIITSDDRVEWRNSQIL